jgi:hypothetical protein
MPWLAAEPWVPHRDDLKLGHGEFRREDLERGAPRGDESKLESFVSFKQVGFGSDSAVCQIKKIDWLASGSGQGQSFIS